MLDHNGFSLQLISSCLIQVLPDGKFGETLTSKSLIQKKPRQVWSVQEDLNNQISNEESMEDILGRIPQQKKDQAGGILEQFFKCLSCLEKCTKSKITTEHNHQIFVYRFFFPSVQSLVGSGRKRCGIFGSAFGSSVIHYILFFNVQPHIRFRSFSIKNY